MKMKMKNTRMKMKIIISSLFLFAVSAFADCNSMITDHVGVLTNVSSIVNAAQFLNNRGADTRVMIDNSSYLPEDYIMHTCPSWLSEPNLVAFVQIPNQKKITLITGSSIKIDNNAVRATVVSFFKTRSFDQGYVAGINQVYQQVSFRTPYRTPSIDHTSVVHHISHLWIIPVVLIAVVLLIWLVYYMNRVVYSEPYVEHYPSGYTGGTVVVETNTGYPNGGVVYRNGYYNDPYYPIVVPIVESPVIINSPVVEEYRNDSTGYSSGTSSYETSDSYDSGTSSYDSSDSGSSSDSSSSDY